MKVVILAGGLGTRLSEETKKKPKPMVNIGKDPILLHIIRIYSRFNFNKFIIAGGYKINFIKEFFKKRKIKNLDIKVINTGNKSMTGGRIYRLKKYLKDDKFMLTYGDGLANIDLNKLIRFHNNSKKIATLTVVRPPARWGHVTVKKKLITKFEEKNQLNEGWINGGFFVFEKKFIKLINKNKNVMLERQPLETLTRMKKFSAFRHHGFWQCMDTLRDYNLLKKMNTIDAPWKK